MPRTKSLKQLAIDYEVHPSTLMRWLHKTFPQWYETDKKVKPRMNAVKLHRKSTYNPKELKLIYDHFGEPTKD